MGNFGEIVSMLKKEVRKENGVQDDFHLDYIINILLEIDYQGFETLHLVHHAVNFKNNFFLVQSVTSLFFLHVIFLYFVLCFI